jgi:hypothetical protein
MPGFAPVKSGAIELEPLDLISPKDQAPTTVPPICALTLLDISGDSKHAAIEHRVRNVTTLVLFGDIANHNKNRFNMNHITLPKEQLVPPKEQVKAQLRIELLV